MDGHTKGTSSRKSYELKDKRHIVQQIDGLVAGGFCSRRKACAAVGIRPLYYTRWKKVLEKADELNSSTEFVPYNTRGTSRKIHPGRESVLAQVKEQLRAFTFKLCEQGVQVTNRMVMREAGRLLPTFKAKCAEHRSWRYITLRDQSVSRIVVRRTPRRNISWIRRRIPKTSLL